MEDKTMTFIKNPFSYPKASKPDPYRSPFEPPKCVECGMELKNVKMYSCGKYDCPVQPRVTM